jgi:hypothetical protein
MDLRHYYEKIRAVEAKIDEEFALVVSNATADGGKAGTFTEVAKRLAARLIVEGLARLATEVEKKLFHEEMAEARRVAEQEAATSRVQLAVLSTSELERLRDGGKSNN